MKTEYYKVRIVETGRWNLREETNTFNTESSRHTTPEEVKKYLKEHYGHLPKGKRRIYKDIIKGGISEEVGFTHSFWNRDISHGGKPWYQTDWIEISFVTEESILLKQL